VTTYPSLYAALEPHTAEDGRRGHLVRCTATRVELGFVWWSCNASNVVTWHWRTLGRVGERTTQRNAVQALRDIANNAPGLPFSEDDDEPVAPERAGGEEPPRAPRRVFHLPSESPAPAKHIVWAERPVDVNVPDLTARIAEALRRRQ
jgi:hypothetical protein